MRPASQTPVTGCEHKVEEWAKMTLDIAYTETQNGLFYRISMAFTFSSSRKECGRSIVDKLGTWQADSTFTGGWLLLLVYLVTSILYFNPLDLLQRYYLH